jgi:hypothetical protein
VCKKKQAENETLKKTIAEKNLLIEQLKRTLTQHPRTSQVLKGNISTSTSIINKPVTNPKDKENNPLATTVLRTTTIDPEELREERPTISISKSQISKQQQPLIKPQLQEVYNQLQRELKGKNDVLKKRTDSFHCNDKKKANATINPYITQAPKWIDAIENENDDLIKKLQDKFAAVGNKKEETRYSNATKEKVQTSQAKANNKSAMTNDEKMHLRSHSHSNNY